MPRPTDIDPQDIDCLIAALRELVRIDDRHKRMRALIYAPGSSSAKAYDAARAALAKVEGK